MIKIDFKQFWQDHIWFGWHRVPTKNAMHWTSKRWYFLGWDFAFIPVLRKGTNPPDWYQKIFMKNFI